MPRDRSQGQSGRTVAGPSATPWAADRGVSMISTPRIVDANRLQLALDACVESLGLLEGYVVCRVLEPDHLLRWRAKCLEIGRCHFSADVVIMSAEHEDHRNTELRDGFREIEVDQLIIHRLERYLVAAYQPRDLPRCDEAGNNAAKQNPHSTGLLMEDRSIPPGETLHREHVGGAPVRGRADITQFGEYVLLLASGRLLVDEVILCALLYASRNQWRDRDDRAHFVRMRVGVQQPQRSTPGVTDQRDLLRPEFTPEVTHDSVEVD